MQQYEILEGTPHEILSRVKSLGKGVHLTLIVRQPDIIHAEPTKLQSAACGEVERALDELGDMFKHLPILPPEAYNRESLYEDVPRAIFS